MILPMTTDQRIAYYEGRRDGEREAMKKAHEERCESQGHEFENCCTVMFQVYQKCKWCGEQR